MGLVVTHHTEETKRKISEAKRGKKLTEEHKQKINPTGRKQPESQKQKVADALAYDWIVITPEGERLEVTNLSAFARERGLDQANLLGVAQGRYKQSKGYVVSYC